jgi:hypothetical protein
LVLTVKSTFCRLNPRGIKMKLFFYVFVVSISLLCLNAFGDTVTDPTLKNFMITIIDWGTSIIGIASIITAITPGSKDNQIVAIVKVILDSLAFNIGYAKDKGERDA